MGRRHKTGRHRKPGNREPNGRPQRSAADYGPTPQMVAKRVELVLVSDATAEQLEAAQRLVRDQRHACLFGVWHMRGELPDDLFAAGMRFRSLQQRLTVFLGGPKQPAALDMDGIGGRALMPENIAAYRRVVRDYDDAVHCLQGLDRWGHHLRATMAAARDEFRGEEFPMVRRGLEALAKDA